MPEPAEIGAPEIVHEEPVPFVRTLLVSVMPDGQIQLERHLVSEFEAPTLLRAAAAAAEASVLRRVST